MAKINLKKLTISKTDEQNLKAMCGKLDVIVNKKGETRLKNGETISWKDLFAHITPGIKFKTSFKKTCDKYYAHFAAVTKPLCEGIVNILSIYGIDNKTESIMKEAATLIIMYDKLEKGLAPRLQNSREHYKFKDYKKQNNYEKIIKLVGEINKLYEERQKPLCWENTPPEKATEVCETVIDKCGILVPLLKFDRELIKDVEQVKAEAEKIIDRIESTEEEVFEEAHVNYNDIKTIKGKIQETIDSRKLSWQEGQLINYLEAQKQWLEHFDKSSKSVPGINLFKDFNSKLKNLFENVTKHFEEKAKEAETEVKKAEEKAKKAADRDKWRLRLAAERIVEYGVKPLQVVWNGVKSVGTMGLAVIKWIDSNLWQEHINEKTKEMFDALIATIKKRNEAVYEKLNKVNETKIKDAKDRETEEIKIKNFRKKLQSTYLFDSHMGVAFDDAQKAKKEGKTFIAGSKKEVILKKPILCSDIINVENGNLKITNGDGIRQYNHIKNWLYKMPYYHFVDSKGTKHAGSAVIHRTNAVFDYLKRCWESSDWLNK